MPGLNHVLACTSSVSRVLLSSTGAHLEMELLQVQVYNYVDRQGNGKDLVEANIVVEREAHRPIILGREGSALKKLSTAARLSMENFLGEPGLVHFAFLVPDFESHW